MDKTQTYKRKHGAISLISVAWLPIVAIPFIQLGYSYYVSFAVIFFALALFFSVKRVPSVVKYILFGGAFFLIKSLINSAQASEARDVLIPMRELLCFIAFFLISQQIYKKPPQENNLRKVILLLLWVLLFLVVIQTYGIFQGWYFGIPTEYYIANNFALKTVEDALIHQTRFRATAFYGEPSYTAFIVLSILTITLAQNFSKKFKFWIFLISLLIVVISQSVAGVLAISLVYLYWVFFYGNVDKLFLISSVALMFFLFFALLLYGGPLVERFLEIAAGNDVSTSTRLFEPAALLFRNFSEGNIFGISDLEISEVIGENSIDNGILKMLNYYGLLIILPLAVMFFYLSSGLLVIYTVLAMNFNGQFFSFDKILIISLVVGLSLNKSKINNFLKINNGGFSN